MFLTSLLLFGTKHKTPPLFRNRVLIISSLLHPYEKGSD
jgi:hypothetical protein